MNRMKNVAFVRWMPIAVILSAATAAMAQNQPPPGNPPPPPPPPPAPVAPAVAPAGGADHDMFVGHMGIGFFGTRAVPVGPAAPMGVLATPVVGLRYWATPMIGIDGGIGFATNSGSTTTQPGGLSVDSPSSTTFLFHAGVPLALAASGHFTFLVIPELDVGFGSGTVPGMGGGPATDLSGFLLQAGARVGGEVHFGFIGIPQLSMDASVGLALATNSLKTTIGPNSQKVSSLGIGTTSGNQPWNIFTQNVQVKYYF